MGVDSGGLCASGVSLLCKMVALERYFCSRNGEWDTKTMIIDLDHQRKYHLSKYLGGLEM